VGNVDLSSALENDNENRSGGSVRVRTAIREIKSHPCGHIPIDDGDLEGCWRGAASLSRRRAS